MLIDRATEARVMQLLQAVGSAYSTYMIGRSLGQTVSQALSSALSASKLTVLEQSYLAGKVANLLGTDALRTMTQQQISTWVYTNNVHLTDAERASLAQLRADTERWIEGRTSDWQAKFRTQIANADRSWRATIMGGRFNDAQARSVARNAALGDLIISLNGETNGFSEQVDRLLQTEMHNYFQHGQVAGLGGDEMVYKVPRLNACPYCMDLHIGADGAPIMYRLGEVMGNSNWGVPAYAWSFTIGPTHPYCYCVLYRTSDVKPEPDEERANARTEVLGKALKHETTPETSTLDMLVKVRDGEPPPPHRTKLVAAIRGIYGDDPPR